MKLPVADEVELIKSQFRIKANYSTKYSSQKEKTLNLILELQCQDCIPMNFQVFKIKTHLFIIYANINIFYEILSIKLILRIMQIFPPFFIRVKTR